MKFKDLFVPRYVNSDPHVRLKFVGSSVDIKLLKQMSEKDSDAAVRKAAVDRVESLQVRQQKAA